MEAVIRIVSAVTERGQTTIPAPVRHHLGIGKPDTLVWRIEGDGRVTVARRPATEEEPDPLLGGLLALLAADMAAHPERLAPIAAGLPGRIGSLSAEDSQPTGPDGGDDGF